MGKDVALKNIIRERENAWKDMYRKERPLF